MVLSLVLCHSLISGSVSFLIGNARVAARWMMMLDAVAWHFAPMIQIRKYPNLYESFPMRQYGLKQLLVLTTVVVVIATFALWNLTDGYHTVFSTVLSPRYKLTIRAKAIPEADQWDLQFTYHYPPAIGMYALGGQRIAMPKTPLRFHKISDPSTGVVCVFDENNVGLLFLYSPSNEDFWETGKTTGWRGTSTTHWSQVLQDLKVRHPNIPYSKLPGLDPG